MFSKMPNCTSLSRFRFLRENVGNFFVTRICIFLPILKACHLNWRFYPYAKVCIVKKKLFCTGIWSQDYHTEMSVSLSVSWDAKCMVGNSVVHPFGKISVILATSASYAQSLTKPTMWHFLQKARW